MRSDYEYGVFERRSRRRYGFWRFMFDLLMTCLTGGLWIIWLLFKFFRNNS